VPTPPEVCVFFYGSYMNRDVLREVGIVPQHFEAARLPGYDLVIRPRANLVASDAHTVYGVLASATHAELERLYRHAQDVLGERYLPHPVLAFTLAGQAAPALCYLAPAMAPAPAEPAYVERILRPARELGFPQWYLAHIEAFLIG
jgi:hypothetical protein